MKSTSVREEAKAVPGRTGRQVMQPPGYRAFIPAALPYDPPLRYSPALLALLSEADQELARLDAAAEFDLVASFVDLGLLREITGGARHRIFQYDPYVAIFGELKP
ncbi:MAG TPA: hypothetical protein VOA80_23585 [Thermoanaerobaculia bacterium]|nr:hypothetical protein [Thermoanaerobaculia bacterium]